LESRCYEESSLNLKHVVIPRLDWHKHYLTRPNSGYTTK
jgi:hypothetical protein